MAIADLNVNTVFNTFSNAATSASDALRESIDQAGVNINDPTNLIRMQKDLANYNMALMVQSSVVKSIEETGKSITQKL